MDGSLMFVIYPATSNDVTVSLRTAGGHDTPNALSSPSILVESSGINNGIMTANVLCFNCTGWTGNKGLDMQATTQPWIWATGPGDQQASDSQDAQIEKHKAYGK